MSVEILEHYRAVLDDLQKRRDALAEELEQLDSSIAIIRRQAQSAPTQLSLSATVPSVSLTSSPTMLTPNYSNMSVRWATLWYLSDNASRAFKTSEVAQAMRQGGYQTTMGDRFGNSVSAVLSSMRAKGEVEAVEDGAYRITEIGRSAWDHIRKTDRFQLTQKSRVSRAV